MRQFRHDLASDEAALRRKLISVALGKSPADLVLQGGRLVNVYTGEVEEPVDIAISGERIALVGDATGCIGPMTHVVNVKGAYLVPGFVDPHYHIESSRLAPWRHAEVTLPRGITVLVEDPHEACASGGLDAIRYILENTEGLPQKVYVQVSSATPPSNVETTGGYIGAQEAREALSWPRVVGLGEMMDPQRIYNGDERLWGLLELAIETGQPIEGHSGFSGKNLSAYASAGVGSTHSPRTPEQAIEMLRRGFFLQLKVEREIPTLRRLLESQIDWSRVGLAVDDRPAERLLEIGGLDNEVRSAIKLGVPPIRAYQMATINNARHWRLDRDHGGIAPGRYADILVVTDLEEVVVSRVFANGREVARDGELIQPLPARYAPAYARETVRLARKVTADDFRVAAPPGRHSVRALVIPPCFWTGTKDDIIQPLPVRDGEVLPDSSRGINKVAVVERHRGTGKIGISFWQWGFQRGAVAMSVLHDSHNISVVGTNDPDMAFAVNRIAELQGGIVVVEDGKVLAELALPIFGLMSDAPAEEVAAGIRKLEQAAVSLRKGGESTVPVHRMPYHLAQALEQQPLDVLSFAFLTCDPWRYVITDQGIFDMVDETPVPLLW
ncbi:MAG TPA: adenine deaminase [Firmicutes bacterium]|nr:adenine deaminase [Candidatus Fermentithermobacillaceae bacterium]